MNLDDLIIASFCELDDAMTHYLLDWHNQRNGFNVTIPRAGRTKTEQSPGESPEGFVF